jgi:phosphate uptake regulator
MKRKIVKHGQSTLTVSIPSKWAKNNNLHNGDLINIEASKDKLILSKEDKYFEEIEIDLTEEEGWYINRILRHLYTSGYDEIKVNYEKSEQLNLIRKSLSQLTGMEIVESNPKYCMLKCIVPSDNSDYHKIVNKIMWLIQRQFDYYIEDCKKRKFKMIDEVKEINATVLRLNNLCRRIINKKSLYDSVISKYVYWFLTSLMNISSFIVYSYEISKEKESFNLSTKEYDLIKTVSKFFELLFEAYKELNIEKTRKFFEQRESLFDEVLYVLKDNNPIVTHYYLEILKEMSSIGNLIISIKVNKKDEINE